MNAHSNELKLPAVLHRRRFLQASALGLVSGSIHGAEALPKVPTVDEELRGLANQAPLRLQFTGKTPRDLSEWQQAFSTELKRLIGPHTPPKEWQPKQLARVELADHVREEWLLSADGVTSVPLHVLLPDKRKFGPGPHPIVLCLHGHGANGHDSVAGIDDTPERAQAIRGNNYDYGRQLAREGFLAVAPCFLPFGRRLDARYAKDQQDPCATTFVRLSLLGQTLLGSNLRDARWALDYACTRNDARKDRIGCVGLSLGGRMTTVTTALDQRIQVAVISGAMNVMQERISKAYSCGAQVIPGLLEIGDTPEIGSLIAPRPCIWEVGSQDKLMAPAWVERAHERLKRAYAAARKPEHLELHRFEGGHQWSGVTAVPLLNRVLKG